MRQLVKLAFGSVVGGKIRFMRGMEFLPVLFLGRKKNGLHCKPFIKKIQGIYTKGLELTPVLC